MNNQKDRVKIAFIGCGNIAHVHMRFLNKAGLAVDAVCDASKIRVDLFADKYGIDNRYTEVDSLLLNEKPLAVHLLTPPHTHYALILKALSAGCNVLVEKPLCQSMKEFREISRLAEEKGLLVSVDHTRVYNPMIVQARKRVEGGEIGRIIRMEYSYDDPSLIKSEQSAGGYRWARGVPAWFAKMRGGVAMDLLPHPLSVILSFDQDLEISHCRSDLLSGGIIDELCVMLKSLKSSAVINFSLNQRPLKNVFSIYGEKGSIRIDLRNMFSVFQPQRRLPGILSRVAVAMGESWQILAGFSINVSRLIMGKAHTYDGLDQIIECFYKSVNTSEAPVEIPHINAGRVTALMDEILDASLGQEPADPAKDNITQPEPERLSRPADYMVFGGTGFIGGTIVRYLDNSKKAVRVFCRPTSNVKRLPPSVGLAFGDLRDPVAVSDSLRGVKTVIHCAAAMSGDWAEFYESTVQGTRNLLNSLEKSPVERFVYISSLGVLDYNKFKNGGRVDESSPVESRPADRGFYTRAKVEAEDLVVKFAVANPHIKVVILRPGLVYGSESNNNLQNCGILLDKYLLVFGLGNRYLGLNYVENLAQAVLIAGEADLASGSMIHVVDPDQPKVREIIRDHNILSDEKVIPIYIPITVWMVLFFLVDSLLFLLNKKRGTFKYRFASNSKVLIYSNNLALDLLRNYCLFNTKDSILRAYKTS
jgi:predicted dehydrogenase/nucleoside-diphosphate-sugar epimerase